MLKIYFKTLPALLFLNIVFLVTSKMMSPNKKNLVIFSTEIGLEVVFQANCLIWKEIIQYLRHKTKQYCHKKTLIWFVLMGANLSVYGSLNKTSGISGFYSEKWVG